MNEQQKRFLKGMGFVLGVIAIGSLILTALSPLFILEFKFIRFLVQLLL